MPEHTRDDELGAALRRLEVPPHRPEFFTELDARLQSESQHHRQRARSRQRRTVWQRGAALVAAVAAATLVMTGVVLPPSDTPGPLRPQVASAAEVRTRVAEALAELKTLQGRVTVTCEVAVGSCAPTEDGRRQKLSWSFATTAAGDEFVTGIGRRDDLAYRVDVGVQRSVSEAFGATTAEVITGLPPGPPDFAARPSVLRRNVAAVVRAFLATTSDVPVKEVTVNGRPAWRLVTEVTPNKLAGPDSSGDSLEVVVDRETGFPLRVTERLKGEFLNEIRLSKLVVDQPVDPKAFAVQVPAGADVFRQDVGFRRVKVAAVEDKVGYAPLLPRETPAGFELTQVAVAEHALPTGSEGANPPSTDVVSAAYRRGFDRIIVTTRRTGDYPRAATDGTGTGPGWADPLASGEGFADRPSRFTVKSGALRGAKAELVISPRGTPHVWVLTDDLVVTAAGDATKAELRAIVGSFEPTR